ncbi:MAG: [Lachnospiraceae bacterium]|nr:[FeFe] hydrogenase H-cluster maturation GTPase HydF [Lachnospiraceae bacterium]
MANDLNKTPSAERIHIGFFGLRNAGKSSLVNAVTGQALSIVSDIAGTTTDPVQKAMELLPLGPVVIIDTPGLDDEGELGALRVKRARQALNRCDIAVLAADVRAGLSPQDMALISLFREKDIPYLIVFNKTDLLEGGVPGPDSPEKLLHGQTGIPKDRILFVSAKDGSGTEELKNAIGALMASDAGKKEKRIIGDLLSPGSLVILVTPIDGSAPKGRMILPQVQTLRDILDADCSAVFVQPERLPGMLDILKEAPALVVTDSQVFGTVSKMVPEEIPLTSFSILMARYKGFLEPAVAGVSALASLKDGDMLLISEGCTHHRQCEDIGTVKLPGWIREYTGKELSFSFTSGGGFPEDLSPYALIVHCGGCMLSEREMLYREKCAADQGIPFTNYGTLIAAVNGILKRSLSFAPDIQKLL